MGGFAAITLSSPYYSFGCFVVGVVVVVVVVVGLGNYSACVSSDKRLSTRKVILK